MESNDPTASSWAIGAIMAISPRPTWFGFNPPWNGNNSRVMTPQYDEQLIKNDLLQLYLTIPGERRNRPTYGTKLRGMVFEFGDSTSASQIVNEITQATQIWEERVTLIDVAVSWDVPQTISITVSFYINGNPLTELFVEFSLGASS